MKRCFSKALILALIASIILSPVMARASEIACDSVEPAVVRATDAGDTGLTVDGMPFAPEQTPEEAAEESPVEADAPQYLRITAEDAVITSDAEGLDALAAVEAGSVALALDDLPRPRIALYTGRGVIAGYIDGSAAARMTAEEAAGYLDALCRDGRPVALYQDDLSRPLALAACRFIDPAEGTSTAVKGEAPGELEFEIFSAELAAPQNATAIRINRDSVKIGISEQYAGLAVVAEPEGSVVPNVTWRSDDEKCAVVDAATGVVTGLEKGTATIRATTPEGLEAKCKVRVRAKPNGIAVEPASITVSKGMTGVVAASVSGGASGQVTFTSNKPEVIAVDENGAYVALAAGKATITARTYNGKKAKCKVRVMNEAAALTFPAETLAVPLGEDASLTPTAVDSDGNETVADVTYAIDPSSPDASCIALDPATGTVSPQHMGTAVVIATTHNNIAASCNVVVASAPESVAISPVSVTIGVGEIYTLTANLTPPSGQTECAANLTWDSSNKKIAAVNSKGQIKGKKTGNCTIRVTTDNGKVAYSKVKVVKAPKKISISPAVGALRVGKTGKYKITLSPKGSGGSVTYASSDPSIATIDQSGVVTAVGVGEVYIGVSTYNGKTAKAKLVVSKTEGDKPTSEKVNYLINLAKKQIGKPYIYDSGYAEDEDPRGFDCSGLVYWLFRHVNVTLLDSAYRQGYDTRYTRLSMSEIAAGDVIFFNTNTSDGDLCDHSALYIGNGNFIHASSTANKVIMSSMSTPGSYYYRAFSWGHRVLQ